MKTRTIMIIALTIAMLSIIFGVGFGVKKSVKKGEETTEAPGDSAKVAKRVFNLIILDESGSMQGWRRSAWMESTRLSRLSVSHMNSYRTSSSS